jgi:undecaprenyl-diphosphatase
MSFLLLVPVVLGAVLYKGLKDVVLNPLPAGSAGPFLVGTLAALAVGLAAIQVLLDYVRRHDYTIFAVYRVCLAVIIVLLIATDVLPATF